MKAPAFAWTWRSGLLGGILLGLLVVWGCFHRQISRELAGYALLASLSPREELFDEIARESPDPVRFLKRSWATGEVSHRRLVATFLKESAVSHPTWFALAEPLLLAAATDADASVRELALQTLELSHSPRLFEMAVAQMRDLDPMVRLLGLEYLRKTEPERAVPVTIRLLDDPDLRVATSAEAALMRWSGKDFGVRMRLAVASEGTDGSGGIEPSNAALIRQGIERRKEWWKLHAPEYRATATIQPRQTSIDALRPAAPDFTLKALDGRRVRLTQFRGQVLVLNFWATWCTACLAEIPQLVALQNKLGDSVAVVGVALDGLPDEHGDDTVGESERSGRSRASTRAKVARAVTARGINYRVLWDPDSAIEGQFDGGELPTTVILDAQGRVRRRFIGERNLAVFQAMIAEASTPLAGARAQVAVRGN